MKRALYVLMGLSIAGASFAVPPEVPPRAFLEYRLRSPAGNPLVITLSTTIPGDVCNQYDIEGEFLPVGERGAWPDFPTFYGDILLIQTQRLCPGSPVVPLNVIKTYRFDPTSDGDDELILLVPSEFRVGVIDLFDK